MESENSYKDNFNEVNEGTSKYIGFVHKSEDERLRENIFRRPLKNYNYLHRCCVVKHCIKQPK